MYLWDPARAIRLLELKLRCLWTYLTWVLESRLKHYARPGTFESLSYLSSVDSGFFTSICARTKPYAEMGVVVHIYFPLPFLRQSPIYFLLISQIHDLFLFTCSFHTCIYMHTPKYINTTCPVYAMLLECVFRADHQLLSYRALARMWWTYHGWCVVRASRTTWWLLSCEVFLLELQRSVLNPVFFCWPRSLILPRFRMEWSSTLHQHVYSSQAGLESLPCP